MYYRFNKDVLMASPKGLDKLDLVHCVEIVNPQGIVQQCDLMI